MNEKFKYYNRSLLPNNNECEDIVFSKKELKAAFKKNKRALFFIYTSNFDCGVDTDWFYVIQDGNYNYFDNMKSKHRRNIKKNLEKLECKMIVASEHKERIEEIGCLSVKSYRNYNDNQKFKFGDHRQIVGCFLKDNHKLVGYEIIDIASKQVSLSGEKVDPEFKYLNVSFALNNFIINKFKPKSDLSLYISNGQRTLIHQSNHNDFLINYLGFRKAYCYLHIVYRNKIIYFLVLCARLLSPLISLLAKKCHFAELVNGVLIMNKVSKKQRKVFPDYV